MMSCADRSLQALKQRGAALLLMVVVMVIFVTTASIFWVARQLQSTSDLLVAKKTLSQTKTMVLNYAMQPDAETTGRRMGQLVMLPDIPLAGHTQYSGKHNTTTCMTQNWTAGSAGIAPNPGSPNSGDARCFGRFPYISFGLALDVVDQKDALGQVPWIAISNNITGLTLPANLNTLMQNGGVPYQYPGFNNDANNVPRPWLTVRDARGNVVSDRVAIVLIYPGTALSTQQGRSLTAHPNKWLDSVTIKSSCQTPCVPGTYSNYGFAVGNTQNMEFIQAPNSKLVSENDPNYTQPYEFNDVLVYITAEEYFNALKVRACKVQSAGQSPTWYTASGWQNVSCP
jgi:hypothetical protein